MSAFPPEPMSSPSRPRSPRTGLLAWLGLWATLLALMGALVTTALTRAAPPPALPAPAESAPAEVTSGQLESVLDGLEREID